MCNNNVKQLLIIPSKRHSMGKIIVDCYCRAVIDLICLILSVIDCVMTSRLIHTSQTTIFRHRTVFIFNRMLM